MSPAKKTTKKKAAAPAPDFANVSDGNTEQDPPQTLVPCPDDFMPYEAGKTSLEELANLLNSVLAFELAYNATERLAYVRTLEAEQVQQLWAWAREMEWALDGKPDGENAVAAIRASRLLAPAFFHDKLAKDLATVEIARQTLEYVIDDVPVPAAGGDTSAIDEIVQKTGDVVEAIVSEALEAPKADADGQLTLVQEPTPPKKPLTPLTFQSGEQVASVRLALQARAEDLKSEAKRLSGLGRTAEAAALEREAKDITEQLLRQVTAQHAIPFNESETLPQAIKRAVQGEVRYRARAALLKSVVQKKGENKQDAEQRALGKLDDLEQLIGNIGEQAGLIVSKLLVEAADRGKEAGKTERTSTASAIAREAIQAVEAALQAERAA